MTMDYKIIDSYIIGISFNSLAINTGDIDRSCLKSRVFISYNKTFDERYYEVAMTLDMGYKPVDKEEFSLSFCYVEVIDVDPAATPMQHREIILDKVTSRAYEKVRLHAATILEMSCYRSLILGDIEEVGVIDDETPIYKQLISVGDCGAKADMLYRRLEDFDDEESVQDDVWLVRYLHEIRDNAERYVSLRSNAEVFEHLEESALNRYYLQFIDPVPYNHPEVEGYTPEMWDMLYRLLFASSDETVLIAPVAGSPELQFPDAEGNKRYLSTLSAEEIDKLLYDTLESVLVSSTPMLGEMLLSYLQLGQYDDHQVIPKSIYIDKFCCLAPEHEEYIEQMYNRIFHSYEQGYLYRFFGDATKS